MSDLISRKKVISILEQLEEHSLSGKMDISNAIYLLEKQPTAYDINKVVEQLEELKSLVPVNRILDDIVNEKPKELGMLIAYRKAIEIVKECGKDAEN